MGRQCKLHKSYDTSEKKSDILSFPLIQEGQLSVTAERICTKY